MELVDSVDELRSSSSTRGISMPNFEVLDARIASALNKIIHNSHFKRRISLEEQDAQKQDRCLHLRTSTLVRPRPIHGDSHIDFLGESEGSLPQPQDSLPDAGEAIHDFWSMSGSFIFRHHVEPRVELYSPREESFPIPLKYIDITRTTHTNLDVKQEKRIDDYWNIDGSRDLSDPWTGFTQFTLLEEKTSCRIYVVRVEINEATAYIQARSSMARALEINGIARQAQGTAKVV